MKPALRMIAVSKRYPGTLAVDGVDFTAQAGEVHALMGENGAGKSTLMKMLAGAFNDYEGRILIHGREARLDSPAAARALGIGMIYQELSLARPISIAENLLAGRLPRRLGVFVDRKALLAEARRGLDRVGLDLDPRLPVEDISLHEAQLVEIAKALSADPRILVMDEPTSALSRDEVDRLFAIIERLKAAGLTIIYISHHLPEIFRIADRVTVLRDGRNVGTRAIGDVDPGTLAALMIGPKGESLAATGTSEVSGIPDAEDRLVAYGAREEGGSRAGLQVDPDPAAGPKGAEEAGTTTLEVRRASRYGFFHEISFTAKAGEVLGLSGLCGAGRSELCRSLCGIDPLDDGEIRLNGEDVTPESAGEALAEGLAYLTEDRKEQGLAGRLSVARNVLAAVIPHHCRAGFYDPRPGRALLGRYMTFLDIQPLDPRRETANLSGGNQQKVLLARMLATNPKVLFLDEPTRGVDVGAKAVIHRAVAEAAARGAIVILVSSDLPELVGLAHRVLVMRKGKLLGELPGDLYTEETVLMAANGIMPGVAVKEGGP